MERPFEVIYEDQELLVVNKPAGLVCHPTKGDEFSSLISRARKHLGPQWHPQLVNRLDRETSGVTVLAKNIAAARELRRLWEGRQVEKEYLAIVHGAVRQTHGLIEAPLGKDQNSRVAIKDCVRPDGAPAQTEYWVVGHEPRTENESPVANRDSPFTNHDSLATLLRVQPHTGRKHQIRIHLAHIGHPVVGDKLYGGDEDLYMALVENRLTAEQSKRLVFPFHALHARAVRFAWRGQPVSFHAEPEGWFTQWREVLHSDGAAGSKSRL